MAQCNQETKFRGRITRSRERPSQSVKEPGDMVRSVRGQVPESSRADIGSLSVVICEAKELNRGFSARSLSGVMVCRGRSEMSMSEGG